MQLRKQETGMRSIRAVVAGNTAAALDLYGQLRDVDGNLFFSPFSISTALAMTYAGARGDTALQMARALHFTLEQETMHPAFGALQTGLQIALGAAENVQLRVANALWPQDGYPLLETFLNLTERYYRSAIFPVDYREPVAACARINGWVDAQTVHKIPDIVSPHDVDAETTLVLVNAIYFKGNWSRQFDVAQTQTAPFWIKRGKQVAVPMMAQTGSFGYAETEKAQILELPYAGGELAMLLVLPRELDGLAVLEATLTVAALEGWIESLKTQQVRVALPRFRMTCGFELKAALMSLGVRDAFDGNRANFAGMNGHESELYISKVLHKAFVDVNEEGTEAAAATAVIMGRAMAAPPPSIRFDHPFLLLIRDLRTGSVLFLGRLVDPPLTGK